MTTTLKRAYFHGDITNISTEHNVYYDSFKGGNISVYKLHVSRVDLDKLREQLKNSKDLVLKDQFRPQDSPNVFTKYLALKDFFNKDCTCYLFNINYDCLVHKKYSKLPFVNIPGVTYGLS